MEIEQRMGLRVRSNYEDVAPWIRSGGGPGVPYPKRKELEMMDSHVYAQLTALLSAQETQSIVDEYRRDGGGRRPPGGPPGGPGNPRQQGRRAAVRPPGPGGRSTL